MAKMALKDIESIKKYFQKKCILRWTSKTGGTLVKHKARVDFFDWDVLDEKQKKSFIEYQLPILINKQPDFLSSHIPIALVDSQSELSHMAKVPDFLATAETIFLDLSSKEHPVLKLAASTSDSLILIAKKIQDLDVELVS